MALNRNGSPEGSISKKIVTTKGDLITATANAIPSRLAAGSNGETLVADSSTSTGLRYQGLFGANKNQILNGDFRINQRAFTSNTADSSFNFDRWFQSNSGGTTTTTPQTFTPGTAPVAGYEGVNFQRTVTASQSDAGHFAYQRQKIEDVRTFANQTITISFWAKAASGTPKIAVELAQVFGSGGSSAVTAAVTGTATLSTSWARYSVTGTVPSISGKTIGTGSELSVILWVSAGATYAARASSIGIQNNTFDIWGVQAEAGSVATPFQTATGTLQGELAACQRYYYLHAESTSQSIGIGTYYNGSTLLTLMQLPVTMRTTPTVENVSGTNYYQVVRNDGTDDFNSFTSLSRASNKALTLDCTSNISGTAGQAGIVMTNNASAKLAFTAEL
jgi:hypothetical protein